MIQAILAILWVPTLVLLAIWLLHIGGVRSSLTLSAVENRFPGLADFFNLSSIDALQKELGKSLPKPVIWVSRIFAICCALALIAVGIVALIQLLENGGL
jgi:hypothetical protein